MTVYVECPRCDGDGQVRRTGSVFAALAGGPDYPVCRRCHGRGEIVDRSLSEPEPCPTCNGDGESDESPLLPCPTCFGTGTS